MGAAEMKLGSESETLEFKKSTSELKEACTSIAAMLSKHGLGAVYFGVKPDGTVIGQDISEATLRSISRAIAESIKPQIYPSITKQVIDGHAVAKLRWLGQIHHIRRVIDTIYAQLMRIVLLHLPR